MKKVFSLLLVCLMCLSTVVSGAAADQEQPSGMIFVATDGDDSGNGSIDQPVKSLTRARDLARNLGEGAVIALRGGVYETEESLELTEQDSGLTIRGYMDEEVIISGATKLDYSGFEKVTDEAVLNRIVDEDARTKIMAYDMKAAGMTNFGRVCANGRGEGWEDTSFSSELYVGGEKMTIARYPNGDEYLYISEVVEQGAIPREEEMPEGGWKGHGFSIRVDDDRLDYWKDAEEPFIFGFFIHDWAEGRARITIDYDNDNLISTQYPSTYGVAENRRVYFFNLLEELDAPGEWWVDQENGILYLYPGDTFNADAEIEMVTADHPFIVADGTENLTIKNLTFKRNLSGAISTTNTDGLIVADNEFYSITDTVISAIGTNMQIISNDIHDVGGKAIYVEGGDRETLTSGNNLICNNKVVRFQQVSKSAAYGIHLVGVGGTISHNYVSECASIAILYYGNNHTVEYNDVSKACMETSDQGAIYSGRDWTCRGNTIRYNYIHDMKMIDATTNYTIQGVYLDDMHSSTEVYGNVFYNLVAVTLYGGGRNNTFQNNVMIDCSEPFRLDQRGLTWADTSETSEIRTRLNSVPYNTGIWAETYPELVGIEKDNPEVPKYNVITGNVSYNTPDYDIAEAALQYGTFENNITLRNTRAFADYKNQDFTILEDSEVYEKLPDFEPIPFSEIGLLDDSIDQVADDSVVLYIGSPRAIAKGNNTLVDPDNMNVQPIVLDDRTLVPVRFIAESFGAQVSWDGETETVGIEADGKNITMQIGSKDMVVDGKVSQLDVVAQTIEDRTMVPLRAIVEALGKTVFWDDKGLIVMSDSDIINEDDTFLIDSLIRRVSMD